MKLVLICVSVVGSDVLRPSKAFYCRASVVVKERSLILCVVKSIAVYAIFVFLNLIMNSSKAVLDDFEVRLGTGGSNCLP